MGGAPCSFVRFAMKRLGSVVLLFASCGVAGAHAADATSPVDYTDRNSRFNTTGQVAPESRRPEIAEHLQERRVDTPQIEKKPAAVGDRRAAVDVLETREKVVREKDVRAVDKVDVPKSRYDQQRSRFSTSGDTTKPPMVAKYQDSLSAASATNMARFPAMSSATTAKINRFIFRKNGAELSNAAQGAKVVPAAGSGTLRP